MTRIIGTSDPVAVAAVEAIRHGDVAGLRRLLADHPDLAGSRLGDHRPGGSTRSLLHVATDWPGHYPNGPRVVTELTAAGADVNARFTGPHTETPLHWAASSDDVAVLDALLDAGADIEAGGGVIGNGTPLADAVAFGQWNTAHRLIDRGARPNLWQAAALGLMSQLRLCCEADPAPPGDEISNALWCACHGGQQPAAAYLLDRGGDPNWIGYDQLTPLDAARRSNAGQLVEWLIERGAHTTTELRSTWDAGAHPS